MRELREKALKQVNGELDVKTSETADRKREESAKIKEEHKAINIP